MGLGLGLGLESGLELGSGLKLGLGSGPGRASGFGARCALEGRRGECGHEEVEAARPKLQSVRLPRPGPGYLTCGARLCPLRRRGG